MNDSDYKHDPAAYEKSILRGFNEMHENTVEKANEIVEKYSGENPSCIQFGLNDLNALGVKIGDYIEQASNGEWPKEVLSILGRTMKHLVESASTIKKSARAFDIVDMSMKGISKDRDTIH